MKNIRFILLLIVSLLSFSNIHSQGLLRAFFEGVASGLGESLVKSFFDSPDTQLKNKLNQLDNRVSNIEFDVSGMRKEIEVINSQIILMNTSINGLDLRLTDLEKKKLNGAFALGYSNSLYNNLPYGQLQTLAVLRYERAQLGLNLNVADINLPDSTDLERSRNDLYNIVDHLSIGSTGGPAYLRLGRVSTSSFGHSFLFRNYTNDLIYNDQQFGMKAGINHFIVGTELFSSSLTEDRLKAARLKIKPLAILGKGKSKNNSLKSLLLSEISYSYIMDRDYNNKQQKIGSLDALIPFFYEEDDYLFELYGYGNIATIYDFGYGTRKGIAANMSTKDFSIGFWNEASNLDTSFVSGYFTPFYELGRFDSQYSSQLKAENKKFKSFESTTGGEICYKGINISGYYVANSTNKKNNYIHLESKVNLSLQIKKNDLWNSPRYITFNLTGAIDQRDLVSLDEFSLSKAWKSPSNDIVMNVRSSVHIPIGETIDVFVKYSNRDFFRKEDNRIQKINTNTVLFGMQYGFGISGHGDSRHF